MRHCPPPKVTRVALSALLGLLICTVAQADSTEADIKAAFIYNFAKFVEWPAGTFPDDKQHLSLCTQDDSLLARKLQQLGGKEAQGRTIEVHTLAKSSDTSGCHILLASSSEAPVGHGAMLTISEAAHASHQSSMINLFVDANRVQFSVNLLAAQQAGIKLSARLLQLARTVSRGS